MDPSVHIEYALPIKAALRSSQAGATSPRRMDWLRGRRERDEGSGDGVMLLSLRQLMMRQDEGTTSISMEEPFRVHLSWWPLGDGMAELHVVVGQGGGRLEFSTILAEAALEGASLPERESMAPLVAARDFARLWVPLVALARAHGHGALPSFGLDRGVALEQLQPLRELPRPSLLSEFEVEATPERLVLRRKRLWRVELVLWCVGTLMAGLFVGAFASEGMPLGGALVLFLFTSFMLALYALATNPFAFDVLAPIEIAIDHEHLRVRRGFLGRDVLDVPVWRLDQLYATQEIVSHVQSPRQRLSTNPAARQGDHSHLVGALHAQLTDGSRVTLVRQLSNALDARFLERVIEHYLQIEDRPVDGEWDVNPLMTAVMEATEEVAEEVEEVTAAR